jgi:DNA-binding SARP family transcriptional activator
MHALHSQHVCGQRWHRSLQHLRPSRRIRAGLLARQDLAMIQDRRQLAVPPPSDLQPLRLELLGGFHVSSGERAIDEPAWRLSKSRSLVKLLALSPGHQLHREQLIDALWPELDPAAGANNLNQALHVARRALAAVLPGVAPTSIIRLDRQMVLFDPSVPLWVDIDAFEQASGAAMSTSQISRFYDAIDLYRGDLLPEDRYDDWTVSRRDALRDQFLSLLLRLASLHEARQEADQAIDALRRVVAVEPEREEAHVGLMRLYALTGRRQQAIRQYERLCDILARELDSEPDAATRRLYAQIVDHRFPVVPWQPETPPVDESREEPVAVDIPAPAIVSRSVPDFFVDRELERSALARELEHTPAGHEREAVEYGKPQRSRCWWPGDAAPSTTPRPRTGRGS